MFIHIKCRTYLTRHTTQVSAILQPYTIHLVTKNEKQIKWVFLFNYFWYIYWLVDQKHAMNMGIKLTKIKKNLVNYRWRRFSDRRDKKRDPRCHSGAKISPCIIVQFLKWTCIPNFVSFKSNNYNQN